MKDEINVLCVSGSPRSESNTDILLRRVLDSTGGRLLKLSKYDVKPCQSCWTCQETGECVIDDDMKNTLTAKLLESDAIVLGTPVYFNNVSSQLKAFMDRTWCLRGMLRNKVGATVVVGRRYGIEGAVSSINSFYLKHEMIPANRGVCGIAFQAGEVLDDEEALEAAGVLGERILELVELKNRGNEHAKRI
jgi:multimeric flavodoxin WrbA